MLEFAKICFIVFKMPEFPCLSHLCYFLLFSRYCPKIQTKLNINFLCYTGKAPDEIVIIPSTVNKLTFWTFLFYFISRKFGDKMIDTSCCIAKNY